MTFSSVWAINRLLYYSSSILAKLLTLFHHIRHWFRDLGISRSSLTWICSYLCGRSQCVFSGSTSSSYRENILGVPQSSVLGLFCPYINDIQEELGDGPVMRLLYADDLQIYTETPPEMFLDELSCLTEAARIVAARTSRNFLTLNSNKTRAIIFGFFRTIELFNSLEYPGISITEAETVEFVSEIRSLGVILDSTLSWKPQINQVAKRVNCALFELRFIKSCTILALWIRLVQSLVTLHLDYCSVVYQHVSMVLKARLQRLSNSAIRYIFGVGGLTRISPFRSNIGWLRLDTHMHCIFLLTMYKIFRMREPPILLKLFKNYASSSGSQGQKKGTFLIQCVGYTLMKLPSLWNS